MYCNSANFASYFFFLEWIHLRSCLPSSSLIHSVLVVCHPGIILANCWLSFHAFGSSHWTEGDMHWQSCAWSLLGLQADPPACYKTLDPGLRQSPEGSHDEVSSCTGTQLHVCLLHRHQSSFHLLQKIISEGYTILVAILAWGESYLSSSLITTEMTSSYSIIVTSLQNLPFWTTCMNYHSRDISAVNCCIQPHNKQLFTCRKDPPFPL